MVRRFPWRTKLKKREGKKNCRGGDEGEVLFGLKIVERFVQSWFEKMQVTNDWKCCWLGGKFVDLVGSLKMDLHSFAQVKRICQNASVSIMASIARRCYFRVHTFCMRILCSVMGGMHAIEQKDRTQ